MYGDYVEHLFEHIKVCALYPLDSLAEPIFNFKI